MCTVGQSRVECRRVWKKGVGIWRVGCDRRGRGRDGERW